MYTNNMQGNNGNNMQGNNMYGNNMQGNQANMNGMTAQQYQMMQTQMMQQAIAQQQGGIVMPVGQMNGQQPQMQQPQQQNGAAPTQWMPMPSGEAGCPAGLEYLTQIDQILVHQQIQIVEMITGLHVPNKYEIKNSLGQQIYFAQEENASVAQMQNCGGGRGFEIQVKDNQGQEIIRVNKPFKCCAGCHCCACCDRCSQGCAIESPPGTIVGTVEQQCSCLQPKYDIFDENEKLLFHIDGPGTVCQGSCCPPTDMDFRVMSTCRTAEVGKITKQYAGLMQETFTRADNFGVTFPMDLDTKMKAVMIGATFLIDFQYFEAQSGGRSGGRRRGRRR